VIERVEIDEEVFRYSDLHDMVKRVFSLFYVEHIDSCVEGM
jgi:hypothetical protein